MALPPCRGLGIPQRQTLGRSTGRPTGRPESLSKGIPQSMPTGMPRPPCMRTMPGNATAMAATTQA